MEGLKRKRKRGNTRSKRSTFTSFERAHLENQSSESCLQKVSKSKCTVENVKTENNLRKKRRKRVRGKTKKKDHLTDNTDKKSMGSNRITSANHDIVIEKSCLPCLVSSQNESRKAQLSGNSSLTDTNNTIFSKTTFESKGITSNQKTKETKRTCTFQERLENKLESGRFRWINEKLYTSSSKCATKLFENDPELFQVYHQGFSSQVQKWPVNPVDVMINWIKKRSSKLVIVDMGCGEAKIAQSVPNKVFSFDMVAANDFVTVSDMAKVPLPDKSVDVVIYCLSLMGTNLTDFLKEAQRILKNGGIMKVAEVVSRFDDIKNFQQAVCSFGFTLTNKDTTNKMFVLFEFIKSSDKNGLGKVSSSISLKPCLYKKR